MQGRVGDVIVDANKQGKILVEVDFVQKVVELMEKEEKTTASNDGKKKGENHYRGHYLQRVYV